MKISFKNKIVPSIYDEAQPLNVATTWGALGAEAVLAQLYPQEISLFLEEMDVLKARKEARDYIKTLEKNGITIYSARDMLADLFTPEPISEDVVLKILFQKAEDILYEYGTKRSGTYKEAIEELVREDIERYGRDRALMLNWKLTLYPRLPMGNLLYARDQMNVLLNKRIRSNMEKTIRKPEVELYEMVYQQGLGLTSNIITIPESESFEGGDAYIHSKTIFVGVGSRTTRGAAIHIYKELEEEINRRGYRFAIVEDKHAFQRSLTEQMLFMHLDTFSNPIGERQIAVCVEEAKKREISFITRKNGEIQIINTDKNFLDFLLEEGEEVIAIPEKEQQTFGCNFLLINKDHIFIPRDINKRTIKELEKVNKQVTYVHLDECTKGYGAAHCMTGQLVRGA